MTDESTPTDETPAIGAIWPQAALHAAAAAAAEHAQRLGIRVTVALLAADGELALLSRMTGATPLSARLCTGKARVSLLFGAPSGDVAETLALAPALTTALIGQWGGDFVALPGAVPILDRGETVGAIGVSGGRALQDLECAEAAREILQTAVTA